MKLKKETACSLFYSNKTWNHQRLSCVLTLFLGPPPSLCCLQLSYVVAHVCYGKSQGAGTGACEQGTVHLSHTPLTYGEHFRSGSVVGCACMCVLQLYISMTHSPPSAAGSLGLWWLRERGGERRRWMCLMLVESLCAQHVRTLPPTPASVTCSTSVIPRPFHWCFN